MKKILIANRGEIALRIMRSAKEMNISTVAVFSEADRGAPFVKYANEAVCIGPSPSAQSYLNSDKIIEVAQKLKVNGIHPGYGFLSENDSFAQEVARRGMTFIGPSPHAIRIMGSKLAAKDAVKEYGIPMIPGTDGAVNDLDEAKSAAAQIGFPVLVKASAGGGGKGMRIVENEDEFIDQLQRAVSEAESSFGDGSVFLEKYISSPRHIEIQVLCDQHGNAVHLFERECSIQRRHQKVIEEAPSSVLTDVLREQMGKSAIEVAKACNYHGVGTVEFLLDSDSNYYFLEMNTRLQVEHPVTEMITGIDLVKEQIKVARGEKLSFEQKDLTIHGHALEVRVYAEDPCNNFLPNMGRLEVYKKPSGMGIRVDDGFEQGMDIPIYYDPMISKLIVHGKDRKDAIDKMICAIDDYQIAPVKTTLSFCKFAINHPAFRSGKFDTNFVSTHFKNVNLEGEKSNQILAAIVSTWKLNSNKNTASMPNEHYKSSLWKSLRKR